MFYSVYKITNTLNGKIYVGVHKTKDLNDGYMGSGKVIKRAIEKYGVENFTKEILFEVDNSEEMYLMESTIVNEEFVERQDTYNLKQGGYGGFDYLNSDKEVMKLRNTKASKIGNSKLKLRLEKDSEFREKRRSENSEFAKKQLIENDGFAKNAMSSVTTFEGQHHSKKSIRRMKETFLGINHQQGETNSQYGTMWIYNLEEKLSKKIKKDELPDFESLGWLKGRKMKF